MTSSDWVCLVYVVLLGSLLWRFFAALSWRPPQEAYKREFSRVRRDVLARDGYRCQRCGRRMDSGLHVHHIHERQYGGSNAMSNLISLCPQCHQLTHGRRF
jgi:5-methylcytosine-specific restriction endonuclease McrA